MATGGMMTTGRQAGQPQLTIEEMAAAVEEAHKREVPVAAHAESRIGVRNAILAGVDSVEHGHGGDQEVIDLMLERGTALVPTILSDRRIIEHGVAAGIPAFVVEQCEALSESLVTFLEPAIRAGVRIAAGNDGGAPLVPMGDMVGELELYVRHGMTPLAALASATTVTAELFGLAGRRPGRAGSGRRPARGRGRPARVDRGAARPGPGAPGGGRCWLAGEVSGPARAGPRPARSSHERWSVPDIQASVSIWRHRRGDDSVTFGSPSGGPLGSR